MSETGKWVERDVRSLGGEITDEIARARWIATVEDLLDLAVARGGSLRVQTVNLHHLQLASWLPDFAAATLSADRLTADGWPVVRLARTAGATSSLGRVTGSSFLASLTSDPRILGLRFALLGGTPEAAAALGRLLEDRGASLVFCETGAREDWEPEVLAERLVQIGAQVTLVAVTPPYGELIGARLMQLGVSGFLIGVGGGLDMLIGATPRAPRWLQAIGMEWLFRLSQDPRRLSRRYLIEGPPAFLQLSRSILRLRKSSRENRP